MMSLATSTPRTEPCPACGVELEVGEMPLFRAVTCPGCRSEVMVRSRSGRYRISDVLGQGGSGRVFRARAEGSDQDVALKVLEKGIPDYEEHLILLRNEAASSGLVDHPRIVKMLSLEEDGEGARLSMELMEGGSLHDLISTGGPLEEARALGIILEVLKGLSAVHAKGIVHRDLKPANILLTASGGAKLADFGLALSTRSKPVAAAHLLATPDYVAPEILRGFRGDGLSDLYSLGGCLFHALFGRPPFVTEGLSLLDLQALKAVPLRLPEKGCSQGTMTLLSRMLNPEPSGRFRTCADLEEGLMELLSEHAGVKGAGSGSFGALEKWLRRLLPPSGRKKKRGRKGLGPPSCGIPENRDA